MTGRATPPPAAPAAQRVAVFAAPRLVPVLEALLQRPPGQPGPSLTLLCALDDAGPDDRLLILYPAPVPAIAAALAAERTLTEALADWTASAGPILTFLRQNRRRVLLVEEAAFLADPAPALARLDLPTPNAPPPADLPPVDALLVLLASTLLRGDPKASALADELQASVLPMRTPAAETDLDAAYRQYRAVQQRCCGLTEDLARVESERDALQQHLSTTRETEAKLREKVAEQARLAVSGERLGLQLAERDMTFSARTRALHRRRDEAGRLRAALTQRADEVLRLTRALESQRQALEGLQARQRDADASMQTVTEAVESLGHALAERNMQLAARTATLVSLGQEAALLRDTVVRHEAEIITLTRLLEQRHRAFQALSARQVEGEAALRSAAASLRAAQAAIAERDMTLAERTVALARVSAKAVRLRDALIRSRAENRTLIGELENRRNTLSILQTCRADQDAALASMAARLQALGIAIAERDTALAAQTDALDTSTREAAQLHKTATRLSAEIALLTRELENRHLALDAGTHEAEALRDRLAQRDEALTVLRARLRMTEQALDRRSRDLETLFASGSGRLVWPIRWLKPGLAGKT